MKAYYGTLNFFRIIPGEFFLFTFSFIFLIYFSIAHNLVNIIQIVIIYLISITPILISEFTRGPKYILPLYTTYITLLIPIAFCINFIFNELGFLYNYYILFALITFLICSRNIFILILDIIPSKLIIYNLFKTLKKNNIKDFYTYDNNFNAPFIRIFQFKYGKDFNIRFIKKINELDKGFVFVPCLASTASYYESDSKIGPIGDFNGDKEIIELIKSKKINNLALAKFKNFGTSKYWQLLNHLSSIRDLLLNEVDNNKKSLGYAWLIDLSKK